MHVYKMQAKCLDVVQKSMIFPHNDCILLNIETLLANSIDSIPYGHSAGYTIYANNTAWLCGHVP